MQQSFKAFPAAKKTGPIQSFLEFWESRVCFVIAQYYSWFYYLLFYLSRNIVRLKGSSFSRLRIAKLGIMKNLKDSMAGTDNNTKELNTIASRLVVLQARELGLVTLAFRVPKVLLPHIRFTLFPKLDHFPFPQKGKKGFYLFFNLAGARLMLLAVLLRFLEKGMSSIVLLNLEMIRPLIRMNRAIRAKGLEMVRERSGWVIRYEASHNHARIVLLDPSIRSEIEYALILIKKNCYNLFMIPEVPIRDGKYDSIDFLGRKINLSSSIKKWFRFFDQTILLTTDSSRSLLYPELSWFEIAPGSPAGTILNDAYQTLEKIVYIHPYLYIPFIFSAFWAGSVRKKSEEASVLEVIRKGDDRLVLMSDGRIFHHYRIKNHA